MGNYCCEEPSNVGNINLYPQTIHNRFVPCVEPKINNEAVNKRIQDLLSQKLPIDEKKYENMRIHDAQKDSINEYTYVGTWKHEKPDGKGIIVFKNDEVFQGEFKDGRAEGLGRLIFANGDYYEGEIRNNKAQGKGKYTGQKMQFVGEWENSQPKTGLYKLPETGATVQLKDGKSCITWPNGNIYNGQIKNLVPSGTGQMLFANGNVYSGQWNQGKFHGKGQYKWNTGQSYQGNYDNGLKQGEGTFYYTDDRRYEGQWSNGKQNGMGKLFEHDHLVFQGTFRNGEQVQYVVSNQIPQTLPSNQVQRPRNFTFEDAQLNIQPKRSSHQNDNFYNSYQKKQNNTFKY